MSRTLDSERALPRNDSPRPADKSPLLSPAELAAALDSWHLARTPRILVIGDIFLDRYHYGTVERIAQEAPTQVLRQERVEDRLGGAAFVAAQAAALGASVTLCGAVGKDQEGGAVIELLRGISIHLAGSYQTNVKHRYLASVDGSAGGAAGSKQWQQLLRVDQEGAPPDRDYDLENWMENWIDWNSFDLVLVADYGKGFVTDGICQEVRELSKPTIVDPGPEAFWREHYGDATIKCNGDESGRAFTQLRARPEDHLPLIITLGIQGILFRGNSHDQFVPPRPSRPIDPTGCGDVVLAVLGVARAHHMDWVAACQVAAVAGGLKVERRGCEPIPLAEVIEDLRN